MSTNSSIRIKRKDGTMTGIYCHWDGYIEGNGVILQLAYNTAEKVEELLKLGNLSSLRYYTEPDAAKPHSFDEPQDDVCVAYHRDIGEGFYQTMQDDEYIYTFDEVEACWYVTIEEFTKNTPATDALQLNFVLLQRTSLLLDEIIKRKELIDGDKYWQSDEFAEKGHVVEACVKKAKEARDEILAEQAKEIDAYYRAYCD